MNPDGTKKWEFLAGHRIVSSPAIATDGTIYFGCYDSKLYAVNPDGTQKWAVTAGAEIIHSSPAIAEDGTIYIGSINDRLYAFNPDGTKKWEYLTGGDIESSPTIGCDGTIYVGSYDGKLHAVNPDGSNKWEYSIGNSIAYPSPTIGADGTIYIGATDNKLHAVNPNGTAKWEFVAGGQIHDSAALAADGTIYFGSIDTKLYALNSDGTERWTYATGASIGNSSPAIGLNGTIYVGSRDKKLYAIKGSSELAHGIWPKFRKDRRNTGQRVSVECDTIEPIINCPANNDVPCSVDLFVPVFFSVTASDNSDPAPSVLCTPASGTGFAIGVTEVNCIATDATGNSANCSFSVIRLPLGFVGFLPPIGGADATGGGFATPVRTFKLGSTIPVKFKASCNGSSVVIGVHTLQASKFSNATTGDSPIDATPQDAATSGNQFRLTDAEWHFNLDTRATGMTAGIWRLVATLSDGSQHSVWIQVK